MGQVIQRLKQHPTHWAAHGVLTLISIVVVLLWVGEVKPLVAVWGDIASWFAAVATSAAAGIAVTNAWLAHKQARASDDRAKRADERAEELERRSAQRDEEEQERMIREQASNVTWWITREHQLDATEYPTEADSIDPPKPKERKAEEAAGHISGQNVSVHVKNASGQPIHHAWLQFSDIDGLNIGAPRRWLGVQPPDTVRVYRDRTLFLAESPSMTQAGLFAITENTPIKFLEFFDSAGRGWRRNADGTLEPHTGEPRRAKGFSAH